MGGPLECKKINGVFDLVPELYNGRALFRKRDDRMVWLRFTKSKSWTVSNTARKDANSDSGWAFAPGADSDLPPVSGWSVTNSGGALVPDEGVSVTHSDAVRSAVSSAALCSVPVGLACDVLLRCCNVTHSQARNSMSCECM
jgi:hypothetical protein